MPPKRPVAVVVVAVLQVVFGGLALLDSASSLAGLDKALGSAGQVGPSGPHTLTLGDVETQLEARAPGYAVSKRLNAGVEGVLALLMIASGAGLLLLRPWGRLLAFVYAALSILNTVVYLPWYLATVAPQVLAFARELAATGGEQAQAMGMALPVLYIGVPVVMSLSIVYPILVLVVLRRPAVRAAFAGEAVPAEPEDYRDPVPPGTPPAPDDRFQAGGP
jgi:hypothetical protein